MASANLTGTVSAQSAPGENVTFTITRPDNRVDTETGATDGAGNVSVTYTIPAAGDYSVVANIPADDIYQAAVSNTVTFTEALVGRTIVISVGITA